MAMIMPRHSTMACGRAVAIGALGGRWVASYQTETPATSVNQLWTLSTTPLSRWAWLRNVSNFRFWIGSGLIRMSPTSGRRHRHGLSGETARGQGLVLVGVRPVGRPQDVAVRCRASF